MGRCLLVLLLAGSAYAGPGAFGPATSTLPASTLIANVSGRTTVSLDGAWRAIVDPFDNGKAGFFRDEKPKDKSERVEYSFDASPVLNVPGDWNTQREQLLFYEGPVWYRRDFNHHKRANTRLFVYFAAANYRASVFLNGEKLGEHEGGFTPCDFEATSQVREGENFLIVEVNNMRRADGVPALKFDWWNYGGLTGGVSLVELPAAFIEDYCVQLEKGKRGEIAGWVQLNGVGRPQKVRLEIPEAGVDETMTADAAGRATFQVAAKLDLWSPERPKLYDVTLTSGADSIHD